MLVWRENEESSTAIHWDPQQWIVALNQSRHIG